MQLRRTLASKACGILFMLPSLTLRVRGPNNRGLGFKYYNINGIWALKPYHLGPRVRNRIRTSGAKQSAASVVMCSLPQLWIKVGKWLHSLLYSTPCCGFQSVSQCGVGATSLRIGWWTSSISTCAWLELKFWEVLVGFRVRFAGSGAGKRSTKSCKAIPCAFRY